MQVGFNVELGGYFSIKRNATSIPGDTWLEVDEVAPYCKAILEVFRSVNPPAACINARYYSTPPRISGSTLPSDLTLSEKTLLLPLPLPGL